jgi:diguanylate cyclase (GGDEF)-like protein
MKWGPDADKIGVVATAGEPGRAGAQCMKVLVAEDSLVSRHLLEVSLRRWDFEPISAGDGNEAWEILQREDAPSMAILDWIMPGLTGLEICRLIRQFGREPYTYVLLLTSKSEKADLLEGMEAGADDYITKPFEQNELKVRLRAGRRIVELHSELLFAREALREQATRDSLTRIWNRHSILDILEKELARASREARPLGLVMFDLDHFKHANDTYGHLAGDSVLRETIARVGSTLRLYDALGRYGGEEFLIVLPGCDAQSSVNQAERTRQLIQSQPVLASGFEIPVTASFGVTTMVPEKPASSQNLIRIADEAMYRAKRLGRNRVEFLPGDSSLEPADIPPLHSVTV